MEIRDFRRTAATCLSQQHQCQVREFSPLLRRFHLAEQCYQTYLADEHEDNGLEHNKVTQCLKLLKW